MHGSVMLLELPSTNVKIRLQQYRVHPRPLLRPHYDEIQGWAKGNIDYGQYTMTAAAGTTTVSD